jgi:anti-anti-sigma factor
VTANPHSGRRLWRLHINASIVQGIPVLFVDGRLGHDAAAEMDRAVLEHASNGVGDVVVDLSGVDYLSGAALRVFQSIAHRQAQNGRRLRVRAPSEAARFALELSGLAGLIEQSKADC